MTERFERQRRIESWNQARLQRARVLVCGRGWLGTFVTWGLASLGVGQILWTGAPDKDTDRLSRWFLSEPSPFPGCGIHDYPFDVEFGSELKWIAAAQTIDVVACCADDCATHAYCARFAESIGAPLRSGLASGGGWVGSALAAPAGDGPPHAVTAMVAAGLVVDSVREAILPLREGRYAIGDLGIMPPAAARADRAWLVGVGGIGAYAATLAAALRFPVHLQDHDRVDGTNLNRQGIFSPADAAAGRFKAEAASALLSRAFPGAVLSAGTARAGSDAADVIAAEGMTLVLSAVDNAATRLDLQLAAERRGVPIVQAGTDVFAADVYTQECAGPTLDQQMHGLMSRARAVESNPRPARNGGCAGDPSYVVPGMIAGGLLMHRALQVSELYRGLGPIHWRAGSRPVSPLEQSHE
jgi:molybdopterin/thiamine biosynthesis adenylyltransferase